MNLEEYKDYALEKESIDYDGHFNAQCVDLIRDCLDKVLNLKQPYGQGQTAKDWWFNYGKIPELYDQFEKIPNLKDTVPQAGDIVIWNAHEKNGWCGHIAIVIEGATIKELPVLEQNYIKHKIGIRVDNYQNCLGFLRRKV